jgi:hypothetical protein
MGRLRCETALTVEAVAAALMDEGRCTSCRGLSIALSNTKVSLSCLEVASMNVEAPGLCIEGLQESLQT